MEFSFPKFNNKSNNKSLYVIIKQRRNVKCYYVRNRVQMGATRERNLKL